MIRTDEVYLVDKNVWNIKEYDTNKLICSSWVLPHLYLIDRNDSLTLKKPIVIVESNYRNNKATDLLLIPGYDYHKNPYILKRAMKSLTLINMRSLE